MILLSGKSALRVTVVGAGLAGSLAAIYLARRGYRVTVLEGRGDLRDSEQPGGRSINLALANRGIRALSEVGLFRDIARLTIPMRGRMLHEPDQPAVLQPYGKDDSEVIYSISRAGLNALLLNHAERAGAELLFHQRIEHIDLDAGTLGVRGRNESLRTHAAGPIIAADGAGSVIRRAMSRHPGCSGSEEYSAHGYKELTIPPDDDDGFRLDPNALHVWPRGGFMMIALPNQDASFTVTLFLPREGENGFDSLASHAALEQFFAQHFADAISLIPDLHDDFFANPTGKMVTVRCQPWHRAGRVVLIGDAAHAIVPFHGQGMNCAFEDCFELDRCLEQSGNGEFETAFQLFEERRRPNANAIADMAIENYIEMRAAVRDPRFHLKKKVAFELEKRWPQQFIPRYSMVMFHHIPYAEAQRRGRIQQQILDLLLDGLPDDADPAKIDFERAGVLIAERLADATGDLSAP